MSKCTIQLETDAGVILMYEIDVDDIETILAIDHIDGALEIIFEGKMIDDDLFEADVFFNYHYDDLEEEAANMQEFQVALHHWIDASEAYDI